MEKKFRYKVKGQKKLIYDTDKHFGYLQKKRKLFAFDMGGICIIEEETQFIGHKDKNKKDIYIGDILNWNNECTILIIETEDLGFTYKVISQKNKNATDDLRLYRIEQLAEKIGNKFEKR